MVSKPGGDIVDVEFYTHPTYRTEKPGYTVDGGQTHAHRWDATHTPRTALETRRRLTQWTGDTHTTTDGTRHTPLYSTGPREYKRPQMGRYTHPTYSTENPVI